MAEHGTVSRYTGGCRCDPCRQAMAAYNAAYREANRDEIAEKQRAYYEANRDEIAEKQRLADHLFVVHRLELAGDETFEDLREAEHFASAASPAASCVELAPDHRDQEVSS